MGATTWRGHALCHPHEHLHQHSAPSVVVPHALTLPCHPMQRSLSNECLCMVCARAGELSNLLDAAAYAKETEH